MISATTIGFHYGKHHRAYVDNLNKAVADTDFAHKSLDDIVKATANDPARVAIFNNAAQDWNHTFYWNSMRPNGGGMPTGAIADHIKDSFGDYAKFRQEFATAAVTQFGSGWAWLVQDQDKKLKVVKTANADTPMARGITCLLPASLGACLLSRLPEPPSGLRHRLDRQARELGFRLATARRLTAFCR